MALPPKLLGLMINIAIERGMIQSQWRSFRALNQSGRTTWGFVRVANFTPG